MLLLTIILFHFINNALWLKIDNFPDIGSCSRHLGITFVTRLAIHRAFQHNESFMDLLGKLFLIFRKIHGPPWPTFIYFFPNLLLFNDAFFSIYTLRLYVDFIFFIILIISAYFIGKKCFNKSAGLLAAFIISFYPSTYGISRQFVLDFPVTGMIALCLCLLLYSENFSKTPYSILFGISLGISTLIKLQGLFFLIFPFFYFFREMLKSKNEHKKKQVINFIIIIIISGLIFFLYWGDPHNFKCLFSNFFQQAFVYYPFNPVYPIDDNTIWSDIGIGEDIIPVFSLESLTYYFIETMRHASIPLFILFLIAIIAFCKSRNKYRLFFLNSIFIPWIIFTLISGKQDRYFFPIIIYIAPITSWWIVQLNKTYLKKIAIISIIVFNVTGFFYLSWSNIRYEDALFFNSDFTFPPNTINSFFNPIYKIPLQKIVSDIQETLNKGQTVSISEWGHGATAFMFFLYPHFSDEFVDKNIIFSLPEPPPGKKKPLYMTENKQIWLEMKNKYKNYKIFADLNHFVVLKKHSLSSN